MIALRSHFHMLTALHNTFNTEQCTQRHGFDDLRKDFSQFPETIGMMALKSHFHSRFDSMESKALVVSASVP